MPGVYDGAFVGNVEGESLGTVVGCSDGEVEGIIGADILEKGKAVIDYEKKRLYLKKKRFN